MHAKPCLSILVILCTLIGRVSSVEIWVAPNGSDENPGSIEKPFKSISRAQMHIRESGKAGKEPFTVYLREGTYSLPMAIVFTPEDSGSKDAPVVYRPYKNEKAAISGGMELKLEWKPYRDSILMAKTPAGLNMDQLFVNGNLQQMARYPNFDPEARYYNGFAGDAFSSERASRWKDPAGGYIHAMHKALWGGYHYRITGKDDENNIKYEGGWQNNRQMGMHKKFMFVENIFEELDAPGEWFHDRGSDTLYFYPPEELNISDAKLEAARLKHLFEFRGSLENPVHHIRVEGLIFQRTLRTFMETKEPLLRSDWTIYRGGAVIFEGAEDCMISDCEFDQVGGNAVFVDKYNRRIAISRTHIHGGGASGICFVGSPDAVRNPLFEYKQQQNYEDIDKTPGPKGDNFPAECVVDDCLIHEIGLVEKQATGVQISMSRGITVRHCSIYDVGRAGINISEGTFGGHLIEFCDVFDTVKETGDHGSFNSWGRDRFWHLKGAPDDELADLSLLDAKKTIIRNSRWRCDHGWDVDLDDGSSNYEIYNNVFLAGGLKLREGFHRHVYNNIAINNSLHNHVWYPGSMDVIERNIWMTPYKPIMINHWGKKIDNNLFLTEEHRMKFSDQGVDANSVVGDPMFIDPANGDFRVNEGSPAFKIGFKNFPMDSFGVQKPELKAIARTPEIPELKKPKSIPINDKAKGSIWLGAEVAAISGEDFSAFGVNKEDGGIHIVEVPSGSQAAKIGLHPGDLVQSIDGKPTKQTLDLIRLISTSNAASVVIGVVRNQQTIEITMPNPDK